MIIISCNLFCKILFRHFPNHFISPATSFPNLEVLKLKNMRRLEEWSLAVESQVLLPCLKSLRIQSCPKLKALPEGLKHAVSAAALHTVGGGRVRRGRWCSRSVGGGGKEGAVVLKICRRRRRGSGKRGNREGRRRRCCFHPRSKICGRRNGGGGREGSRRRGTEAEAEVGNGGGIGAWGRFVLACWPVGREGLIAKTQGRVRGPAGGYLQMSSPPLQSLWIQIRRSRW
jgi:hypothetical protein